MALAGHKRGECLGGSLLRMSNGASDGTVDEGTDRPEPRRCR